MSMWCLEQKVQIRKKVLGIVWDMIANKFALDLTKVGKFDPSVKIAKRSILSMVAKQF